MADDRSRTRLLTPLGWSPEWEALLADSGHGPTPARPGRVGRVIRVDRGMVLVSDGLTHEHAPPRHDLVTVGDWVVVDPGGRVDHVLPRASLLARRDPSTGGEQALAANVDVVLIVCGLDRPVKAGRILRAVTQAWEAGARPLVVLTKADAVGTAEIDAVLTRLADELVGVDAVAVSALTSAGLDELAECIGSGTLVMVGESGSGKTTLLNLFTGADAPVDAVRSGDHKGRHTTTRRELHLRTGGGTIIDTPGVRALGLWADVAAVGEVFEDVDELAANCRFNDCRHEGEPGCAVTAAVDSGTLAPARLAQFVRLRHEAEVDERRRSVSEQRAHDRAFGRMIHDALRRKGRDHIAEAPSGTVDDVGS
ncbi:MAG: ribosome small subunit-dependent GTPase A [Acidimicrobiia bacterium]